MKITGLLAEPLTQVLLLLLVGLVLLLKNRQKLASLAFIAGIGWLWLASTSPLANYLMAELEQDYPPVAAKNLPVSDVIILLGGAVRGEVSGGALADMSAVGDRLIFAAAAYKAGRAPLIVVTGGADQGFTPKAQMAKDILVTMGVPGSAIVVEDRNRVTLDNRRFTRDTLSSLGSQSALLVTSAFHMRRSLMVFSTLDIDIFPAPTDFQLVQGPTSILRYLPNVKSLQRTSWAMHEMAGYLYYLALESISSK